jgi:peptide/nickel transport system permease protein
MTSHMPEETMTSTTAPHTGAPVSTGNANRSPQTLASSSQELRVRSLWGDAFRRLMRNKLSMVGLVIVLVTYVIAIIGPYITPYDYLEQNLMEIAQPPSADHWLGTDNVGRDYLSRMLYAMRTAVLVSILVPTISLVIGVFLGTIAAYRGGWTDGIIMRVTEVTMIIPVLLFAALINISVKDPVANFMKSLADRTGWDFLTSTVYVDYVVVFGLLSLIMWESYARLSRGQVLSLREADYVLAAESLGASGRHVMLRHLIPNSLSPLIVAFTFGMSGAMTLEASLSFLGIGIQPPGASLGSMISSAMTSWRQYPHLIAIPAIVLGVITLAINFLGDGLNDALNPKQADK